MAWVAGLRAEHQPVSAELVVELVQHDARLDDAASAPSRRPTPARLQYFDQSITTATLRALPGQAGAAAAREHRGAVLAAHRDGVDGGLDRARDHDADRHLPVVRARRWRRRPGAGVEPDLAVHRLAESRSSASTSTPTRSLLMPGLSLDRSQRTSPQ